MVTVLTSPNGHKKQWNRRLSEHHERPELYPLFTVASILGTFTLTSYFVLTVVLDE